MISQEVWAKLAKSHVLCWRILFMNDGSLKVLVDNEVKDVALFKAAENDAGAEDDWKRTQARRKQRGLSFLRDKLSASALLVSLAIANLLAPLSCLLFKFCDSDRQGIPRTRAVRAAKRLRRRSKGAEQFSIDEDDETLVFDKVRMVALRCTKRLWQEVEGTGRQALACADAFWHGSLPEKFANFTENLLRNIAAIRWRVLTRFDSPPWSLSPLSVPGCSAETVPLPSVLFIYVCLISTLRKLRHQVTIVPLLVLSERNLQDIQGGEGKGGFSLFAPLLLGSILEQTRTSKGENWRAGFSIHGPRLLFVIATCLPQRRAKPHNSTSHQRW